MIGNDIENLIQAHTDRLNMYTTEKEYLLKGLLKGPAGYKAIDYSGMPHGSGGTCSIDREWDKLQDLQSKIDREVWAIDKYREQLKGIKDTMIELKSIDAQVKYLRDFKGMRLKEIANELNISERYTEKISSRNKRNQ